MRRPFETRYALLAMAILVLLCLASACADEPAGTAADQALPSWLERVYPPPGAEVGSIAEVQVDHNLTAEGEQIRLAIDGTDVTVYSDLDTGELVYDVETGRSPVELDPGTHTATVQRTRVPEDFDVAVDEVEVLDEFAWEFRLQ